jgi:hypothetical protein
MSIPSAMFEPNHFSYWNHCQSVDFEYVPEAVGNAGGHLSRKLIGIEFKRMK